MARINIEECWWSDPRRSKLTRLLGGDARKADGLAIETWRLAQEFWKRDRQLVPLIQFESLDGWESLVEARLVEVRGDSVYVRGSSQYLDWVAERRQQAAEAGRKSAEARRQKFGTAQPLKSETPERPSNDPRTTFNDFEPSVSGSLSLRKEKKSKNRSARDADASELLPLELNQPGSEIEASRGNAQIKAKIFVAAYVKAYQSKFPGGRPEDLNDGKVRGQILNWIKDYPLNRALELIQVYFQMDTRWFDARGYDFLTFRNNLNKIGQTLDSGTDPEGNQFFWSQVFEAS